MYTLHEHEAVTTTRQDVPVGRHVQAWTRIGDGVGPGKRSGHALAYDAHRGRLVLFGGTGTGSLYLDDTWEYR